MSETASSPEGIAAGRVQPRAEAYNVFVSSTFREMAVARREVAKALSELNVPLARLGICLIPIDLQSGAESDPPLSVCLDRIEACDLVVVLAGRTAGSTVDDGRSFTECEFDHATTLGIPCLAYLLDETQVVVSETGPVSESEQEVVERLRRKIDARVKRDLFSDPHQLRANVMRDVMRWVLAQPTVADRLARFTNPGTIKQVKEFLDAIDEGDISRAVDLVTSRHFEREMRRFGTLELYRELLHDSLELGKLSGPKKITDSFLRSRLLLALLSHFPDSPFASAALAEAIELESAFNDPLYSFYVARSEARLHANCDRARPALNRMWRSSRATKSPHRIAEACRAIADHYAFGRLSKRARRWYWASIAVLCADEQMCPYCLAYAYLGLAALDLNEHVCGEVNCHYIKAFQAAKSIRDKGLQARALAGLGDHLSAHGELADALACAVLSARLSHQASPERYESSLEYRLAEYFAEHGREAVGDCLGEIAGTEEERLRQLIANCGLSNFAESLELDESRIDDHR